jgi:hypothetical protein
MDGFIIMQLRKRADFHAPTEEEARKIMADYFPSELERWEESHRPKDTVPSCNGRDPLTLPPPTSAPAPA